MRISKGFIKSSLTYTVAGALPLASGFILLPFYILYLPKEVYGALAICLSTAALVQIIVSYSFDTSLLIHYHELKHDRQKLASFISSAFIFILGLGVVTALVSLAVGHFIFSAVWKNSTLSFFPYGWMAVGVGIQQAIFKVYCNLLQTREKPETFFISNVVSFTVIVVLTIVGLKMFPQTLIGPMGARLVAGFMMASWVLVKVFREFGIHFQSPWKTTSFSFNAYTFIYQLQQWTINYVHQFVIVVFMPQGAMATVGLFEFAMKCMAPLELLLNGLNASINPKIVQLLVKQPEPKTSTPEVNRYFYGLVAVMLIAGCFAILSFPVLITWFVTKTDFFGAMQYLPYIAVIFIVKAVRLYFVVPFTVLKKMKTLMVLNFIVTVLKIVVMIFLIQKLGVYGIILATILLFAFELILLRRWLAPYYQMKFNFFKAIGVPYLMTATILVTEWLMPSQFSLAAHIGYCIVTAALLWLAYRNEIKVLDPLKVIR